MPKDKERLLDLLSDKDYVPSTLEELSTRLRLPPHQRTQLGQTLRYLEQSGQIIRTKKGRYIKAREADLFAGLGRDGYMLVNSTRNFGELGLDEFAEGFHRDRLLVVPASSLAMTYLGRPLPGAALLGGFAALTWAVSLDSVLAAIDEKFTGKVAEGNARAARAAFAFVRDEREALTDA